MVTVSVGLTCGRGESKWGVGRGGSGLLLATQMERACGRGEVGVGGMCVWGGGGRAPLAGSMPRCPRRPHNTGARQHRGWAAHPFGGGQGQLGRRWARVAHGEGGRGDAIRWEGHGIEPGHRRATLLAAAAVHIEVHGELADLGGSGHRHLGVNGAVGGVHRHRHGQLAVIADKGGGDGQRGGGDAGRGLQLGAVLGLQVACAGADARQGGDGGDEGLGRCRCGHALQASCTHNN